MPAILFGTLHGDVLPIICAKYCWFEVGKSIKNVFFLLWPWNVKGHSEFITLSSLICLWLDSKYYFSSHFCLLNALELKLQVVECCNTREKWWPLMTSKSDPRCQVGLKISVHAFVIVLCRCANFRQIRSGSGTKMLFSVRFDMEWPVWKLRATNLSVSD